MYHHVLRVTVDRKPSCPLHLCSHRASDHAVSNVFHTQPIIEGLKLVHFMKTIIISGKTRLTDRPLLTKSHGDKNLHNIPLEEIKIIKIGNLIIRIELIFMPMYSIL